MRAVQTWALVVALVLGVDVAIAGLIGPAPVYTAGSAYASARAPHPMVMGSDWTLLSDLDDIVRWPCDQTITVTRIGPAPTGGDEAIAGALARLVEVTGLEMVAGPAQPRQSNNRWVRGHITVRYVDSDGAQVEDMNLDTYDAVGLANFQTSGQAITAGRVVMLGDHPFTDPTTDLGQAVLLHELAHAVGVGHNDNEHGIMSPWGTETELIDSDRYGLRLLACPA
ncbi:MAG: DUF4157 domain-containing protein [Beutenbergiaceae bacterium]